MRAPSQTGKNTDVVIDYAYMRIGKQIKLYSSKAANRKVHALKGNTSWWFRKPAKPDYGEPVVVDRPAALPEWSHPYGALLVNPGNTPQSVNWFVSYFQNQLADDNIYWDIDVQLRAAIANMDHIDPNSQGQFSFEFGVGAVVEDPMQGTSVTEDFWNYGFQNGKSNVAWGTGTLSWGSFASDFTIRNVKLSNGGVPKPVAFWITAPNTWYVQGSTQPQVSFSWVANPRIASRHVVVDGGGINITGGTVGVSGSVSVTGDVSVTGTVNARTYAREPDTGEFVPIDALNRASEGDPTRYSLTTDVQAETPVKVKVYGEHTDLLDAKTTVPISTYETIIGGKSYYSLDTSSHTFGVTGDGWSPVQTLNSGNKTGLASYGINPTTDPVPVDLRQVVVPAGSYLPIAGTLNPGATPLAVAAVGIVGSVTTVGAVAEVAQVTSVANVATVATVGAVFQVNESRSFIHDPTTDTWKKLGDDPLQTSVTGTVTAALSGPVDAHNHVWDTTLQPPAWVKEGESGVVQTVNTHNYVWDSTSQPPSWVREGESGVTPTVNSQNYVWDQTLQPPAWVREGESGNVPTANVNVQSIAAQSAPLWFSTVKPGVPAIQPTRSGQSEIGMLGAGASKGDGPSVRGSLSTEDYVGALELMGLKPSCVPDFCSADFMNKFKLAVATRRLRADLRRRGSRAVTYEMEPMDIGLLGAGNSKGDGPSVGSKLSPRTMQRPDEGLERAAPLERTHEVTLIPTIHCENAYEVLDEVNLSEQTSSLLAAANVDIAGLEDSGHHVLASYIGHLALGRDMPGSRISAYPSKDRKQRKEEKRESESSSSGSSSEDEGKRKPPKNKEQQEKDQAGALERITSAISSPEELLSWLYTHRSISPTWRRQVISSALKQNKEWEGDVCVLLIETLLANGDSDRCPKDCFKRMIDTVTSGRHSQFQSLKRACQRIPLSELYDAFERIEGEFPPAMRLVCIETNPGPSWVRDLTEEGIEPNPGPMDEMPDTMEGVRALPTYESVVESACGVSPDVGEVFDPIAMIANIAGQYGLGNAASQNTSYQMGMRNQAVLADNTFIQNAFSWHAECFTHPLNIASTAQPGQMIVNPNGPEIFGASLMAYKPTRAEVITPEGEDMLVMVTKQAAIRDNQISARGKYIRDQAQHLVGAESTYGTDLNVPLTKLCLYSTIFATAQPSSQCPWGNELAATDSGIVFAGGDNAVQLTFSDPNITNIAGVGCTDGNGLNLLPFSDNAVRGRLYIHITDATVPTGATKIEMQNDLMLYAWNGNAAITYGLYALCWGRFPQGIGVLAVPATYVNGGAATVSYRVPYANLNEIDGLGDIHLVTCVDVASAPATDQASANSAAYVRPTWGAASGGIAADTPLNINFDANNLVGYDLTSFCVSWLRRLAAGANGMDTLHRFAVAYAKAFSVCSTFDNVWRDTAFMSVRYPRLLISNHQAGNDFMFPVYGGGTTTSNPAGHLGQPMTAAFCTTSISLQHYAFSLPNPIWHNRIAMGVFSPVGKPMDTVYVSKNYYNTRRQIQYQMMWARVCAVGINAVMSYHGLPHGIWRGLFGDSQFRDQIAELRRYYIGGTGAAYDQAPEIGHVPASVAAAITGYAFTTDDLGRTIFERLFVPVYGINSAVRLANNAYAPATNCVPVFLPDLHMAQYSGKLTLEVAPYLSLNKKGCGIIGPNFRTMVYANGSASMPIDPEDSFTVMGIDSIINSTGRDSWNAGLVMSLFNGSFTTYAGTLIDAATYVNSGEYASLPTRPPDFSWGQGTVLPPASVLIGTRRTIPVVDSTGSRIMIVAPQGSKQQMYQVLSGAAFTTLPAWSIRNVVPNPSLLMTSEAPRQSKLKARTLALNGDGVRPAPDSGDGTGQSQEL